MLFSRRESNKETLEALLAALLISQPGLFLDPMEFIVRFVNFSLHIFV